LGANGKNIYPEELEAYFDNKYAVGESLVVLRDEKLVVLVYPDPDAVASQKMTDEDIQNLYRQHLKDVNGLLPSYMNISKFEIHPEEFVKTPKRSIKRFLYS
jgi:long-chain acyl-CoA synthetase